MNTLLIYYDGEDYEREIKLVEFEDKEDMIKFINKRKIGERVVGAYEVLEKINIKPVKKVTVWELE